MKVSQLFTKTSKNMPADEVAKNAQLLIQAGFVHKEMAGVYSFLPLGLRVLRNIEQVVREEMDAAGGQELLMPALQLKDRYELTGRWSDDVVDNWFKTTLANGMEVGLGFSHEENLTPIVQKYASSYRDLPTAPYQIQWKFRNELRSKSGIMRGREFLMKDMYSFALDQAQHEEIYERIAEAYTRIYERLGISTTTVRVLASGGVFSKYSDEFQTFSEAGEDLIFQTADGTYYNREIAPSKVSQANAAEDLRKREDSEAPGVIGVQALIKHFNIPIEKSTKTLIYTSDTGEQVIAALRSDYEINTLKLCEVLDCESVALATADEVAMLTGAEIGYAGLVDTPEGITVLLDDSLEGLCNFETGTNKTGFHTINANFGRDVAVPERFYDLKIAQDGDLDPTSSEPMVVRKAIEVGNIFSLGTKFSKPFGLEVTAPDGSVQTVLMGCYGFGVSRLMGTIAELVSDDRGLVWPEAIAPFKVYLVRLGESKGVVKSADQLYHQLTDAGVTVLYDDRDTRAGEKFADADLIGIPHRIVVSDKTLATNKYEYKSRTSSENQMVPFDEVIKIVAA